MVAGGDAVLGHGPVRQVDVEKAGLALHVDEEGERGAVGRPHWVMGIDVVVLPGPRHGPGGELVDTDRRVVARAAGEGQPAAFRRPGELAGEELVGPADPARLA